MGRECRRCGQEGHFSRSSICKGRASRSSTNRRVEDYKLPADWEEANYSSGEEDTVARVEEVAKKWPVVKSTSKTANLRRVGVEENRVRDGWVNMQVGGTKMFLYADTGSKFTIITLEQYREDMGEVVAADTKITHFVADASPEGISASPEGISASLYQEEQGGGPWEPVDHCSRALSASKQRWKSQIGWESLAKSWGMTQLRHYLVGTHFFSWGDHEPLLPYYKT